ncbi:MAG: flagellar basal body L-ring protein FlgH [bacterium]|nr:flagellar basal body L-ring protein FlgH [bacterium]
MKPPIGVLLSFLLWFAQPAPAKKKQDVKPSPIDIYIQQAQERAATQRPLAGSLYSPSGMLADISRDLRASQVDDIVTVLVSDSASAISSGATNSSRTSSAKSSILKLLGPQPAGGALADLAELGGEQKLQGQGSTSRTMTLTTTITARVTHVLPNGYLVVRGTKDIWVNSERQQVTLRGVVRWNDLDGNNRVASNRLANLEVRVNGKGVVGDAIRRPNFLVRLLLGLLPF